MNLVSSFVLGFILRGEFVRIDPSKAVQRADNEKK